LSTPHHPDVETPEPHHVYFRHGRQPENGPQEWEERMKKKLLRSRAEKTRKTHIYNSEDRGEGKPALDANSRNCEGEGVALARLRDDIGSGKDRVYYTNWGMESLITINRGHIWKRSGSLDAMTLTVGIIREFPFKLQRPPVR